MDPNMGGGRAAALMDFLGQLHTHVSKAHPTLQQTLIVEREQFYGMRLVSHFNVNDADLEGQADRLRWHVHQMTLRAQLADRGILGVAEQQTAELLIRMAEAEAVGTPAAMAELNTFVRERLINMLTETRDLLQEPNRYPPAIIPGQPDGNLIPS